MKLAEKFRASLVSGIVGDALGVPVEFSTRQELALCSVKNMVGFGRYDEPEGTWSDDTSLSLCTMESLCTGFNLDSMGRTFANWLFEAYWTPSGYVFDAGLTTFMALDNIYTDSKRASESGYASEDDNGNGSLMRILPAALYFAHYPLDTFLESVHAICGITHAHPRAQVGCGIYSLLVRALLKTDNREEAYRRTISDTRRYYGEKKKFVNELPCYERILSGIIPTLTIDEINSSGYIVDTLEASLWCFLKNDTTKEILLAAVNLGLDTDTTGMVAGGIGGLHFGLDSIPPDWLAVLARKEEIDELIFRFIDACMQNRQSEITRPATAGSHG